MDHFVDERDYRLLDGDRFTFFVLRRIVGGGCRLLLSDHKDLILCYSCPPFPVWLWTPDEAPDGVYEKAYLLLSQHGLLETGYKLNVKYGLAEYLLKRGAEEGKNISLYRNMCAYECPEPVEPAHKADGGICRCTGADIEELAEFRMMFQKETGVEHLDATACRQSAENDVASGNIYFWQDENGRHTASCKYAAEGEIASLGMVFTRPEQRRRHYAQNLVYAVTSIAKNAGYRPMLYTNGDYTPSNACYQKIGYILRGRLCTLKVL